MRKHLPSKKKKAAKRALRGFRVLGRFVPRALVIRTIFATWRYASLRDRFGPTELLLRRSPITPILREYNMSDDDIPRSISLKEISVLLYYLAVVGRDSRRYFLRFYHISPLFISPRVAVIGSFFTSSKRCRLSYEYRFFRFDASQHYLLYKSIDHQYWSCNH